MKKQGVFLGEMAAGAEEASIDIIGVIGWEVAFTELKRMFAMISESVKRVTFNIYSPGGDVWDGNGIVQAIGELGKTRETVARVQVAASMATLIAVACQKRSIASNGRFLIHNAWTTTSGDASEHEKRAKELRDCEAEAAKFYATRTNGTPEQMLALMAEERWMTPEETMTLGFVQSIDDPFNPEEVAGVRAEIEAAGKWPQALVEIPQAVMVGKCKDCGAVQKETTPPCAACGSQNVEAVDEADSKTKENEDEHAGTEGGKSGGEGSEAGNGGSASQSANADKSGDTHESHAQGSASGYEVGYAAGRSDATGELAERVRGLQERLTKAEALAAKHQGERDKAIAKNETDAKLAADQIKTLTEKLDTATARVRKFLDGALAFSPSVDTWADALKACGGDYEKAAKQYPELKRAFNKTKESK